MKIIQNICSFKLLLKFALKQYIVVVVVNGLCQVKLKSLFFFYKFYLKFTFYVHYEFYGNSQWQKHWAINPTQTFN